MLYDIYSIVTTMGRKVWKMSVIKYWLEGLYVIAIAIRELFLDSYPKLSILLINHGSFR